MRHILILTTAILLGQASVTPAQVYPAYGDPLAVIDNWYLTYLGRSCRNDPGSAGWVNLLRQGREPMWVLSGILGGDEYFNRVGGTMPAFVQAMITQALGHRLTQAELDYWMQRAYAQNRQQLAYAMLTQNPFSEAYTNPPAAVIPDRRQEWERVWRQERHEHRRPFRW
jgi:hypothetical protein